MVFVEGRKIIQSIKRPFPYSRFMIALTKALLIGGRLKQC